MAIRTISPSSGHSRVGGEKSHDSICHVIGSIGSADYQERVRGMIEGIGERPSKFGGTVEGMIGSENHAIYPPGFEDSKGDGAGS